MLTSEQTVKLLTRVVNLIENDPEFSAAMPDAAVSTELLREGLGLAEALTVICEGYRDRAALGTRAAELVTVGGRRRRRLLPRFETITYGELLDRIQAVAASLQGDPVMAGDRVATLGFASVDYSVIDLAIPFLSATAVPLHAAAPVSVLTPMVAEVEPTVIASSIEELDTAVRLAIAAPSVQRVVVFDYFDDVDDHLDRFAAAAGQITASGRNLVLEPLAEVIERGQGHTVELPASEPDRIATIIYTSGSTGTPKGAIHQEALAVGGWTNLARMQIDQGIALPAITVNYLPMSHTGGRGLVSAGLGSGGTGNFVGRSDFSTIIEDFSLVRPTQLTLIPRIWELLHQEYLTRLGSDLGDPDAEERVRSEIRNDVLGDRYVSALSGSAPISPEIEAWVEQMIDGPLMNGFGSTEAGAVVVDGNVRRPPVIDYKLVDVPELGYFSSDHPHPRGELLVKSETLFAGYYKRPDLTAEVFDEDGFYRTGDVMAELGPDQLEYVDRRNNVVKLSNGEFVTVSKLETAYAQADHVEQIYVYGNSAEPYLLAVVVPTATAAESLSDADLKQAVLGALQGTARRLELQSYEVPRDLLIEREPFSLDNGLLSGIGKPSRPNLKARYAERLEGIYAGHKNAAQERWRSLAGTADSRPIVETVCAAAGAVLGQDDVDPDPSARFTDLGGDSLSAVEFASSLSDLFGVEIEVGVVISPVTDLAALAEHIEALRDPEAAGPTFSSVHGAGATSISANDLTLDRFIPADIVDRARDLTVSTDPPRHVFVTGATGYLGRYLALDWLERMSEVGGMVTCLVRGRDDDAARARLDDVFDTGDVAVLERYRSLAEKHLQVVAGDKGAARMGLDDATWDELCESVDLIVDPAALVNHRLPYPQMFGPNVAGTAELIRLAVTAKLKPIAHVSSIAVGMTIAAGQFTEDADVRVSSPARMVDDSYASGYASSKWAGEVLLREAHDLCGLPVTVFRCDMIMAEPSWVGQLNLPDTVTRLVLSLAATGVAPASFYLPAPDGGRARAHFDGLPVDFVSDAISTIGAEADRSYRTFHVVNPYDDGVSLDTYVDWMIEAGCRIERIADFDQWFARFTTSLRNLPDDLRQASLLPLADSFGFQQPAIEGAFATADLFTEAVTERGLGANGVIPGITAEIIAKYVDDLEVLGYLDPAARSVESIAQG